MHLMDGRIAGYFALRAAINGVIAFDKKSDVFRRVAMTTRRGLVISVDGQSATDPACPNSVL